MSGKRVTQNVSGLVTITNPHGKPKDVYEEEIEGTNAGNLLTMLPNWLRMRLKENDFSNGGQIIIDLNAVQAEPEGESS